MKTMAPKIQRCAIYPRKSTEHNLDLAFNSLDAQREACEAYIKSQAHEGWKLIPGHFDDGGLSGASLERPALQMLLEEVKARKVDIIVVYKVDWLTRSLADFAKLVELFDAHEVSFVSVTQSFNTTSSMGRLTLNVLLSFAQFEREVIGERVRDKIAASKRKGIWVGGPVPLGYRSKDKKIEIVPDEAELVRRIFTDYLRVGSIGSLTAELNSDGLKPKQRVFTNGRIVVAEYFCIGSLAYLLRNRFYIGEVAYRGEIHKGEHEAILDRNLFEAVQQKLAEQAIERKLKRSGSPYLLAGLLFDDQGNRMTPSHANKKGVRYRYYVSQAVLQNRKEHAGTVTRVSAPDLEDLVMKALKQKRTAEAASGDATRTRHPDEPTHASTGAEDASSCESLLKQVRRIVIHKDRLIVSWLGLRDEEDHQDDEAPGHCRAKPNTKSKTAEGRDADRLSIPFSPNHPLRKGIAPGHEGGPTTIDAKNREALLMAIARSSQWMQQITSGGKSSFEEIAAEEHLAARYIRRLAQLAYLSPKIAEAIESGTAPAGLTVSGLTESLPYAWAEQEQMLGLR